MLHDSSDVVATTTLVSKLQPEFQQALQITDITAIFTLGVGIVQHDQSLLGGEITARLTRILTEHEVSVGGPYASHGQQPDLLTNICIALFLQFHTVDLPQLHDFIVTSLHQLPVNTDDYAVFCLFFASHLEWINRGQLQQWLGRMGGGTPRQLALIACVAQRHSLQVVKYRYQESADVIIGALGVAHQAAFDNTKNSTATLQEDRSVEEIYKIVHEQLQYYDEPMCDDLHTTYQSIKKADAHYEISLFPYYFAYVFKKFSNKRQRFDTIKLGAANVLCWAAYTLYDGILDGDGSVCDLPTANVAMRRSLSLLSEVFSSEQSQTLIAHLFDAMDQANAWELLNTRLKVREASISIADIPDYRDLSILSNRAAGHIVAPLCMAQAMGLTDKQQHMIHKGLHHYLVARQLNDDLHDWVDDLHSGRSTYVVSRLLVGAKVTQGTYMLSELEKRLKYYFWHHGFEMLSQELLQHVAHSKSSFRKTKLINPQAQFFQFLVAIEQSIKQAKQNYKQKQDFLQQMRS
jgi:hypothetical protein